MKCIGARLHRSRQVFNGGILNLRNSFARNRSKSVTVYTNPYKFCQYQHWNVSFYQRRVIRLLAFTAQTVKKLAQFGCIHVSQRKSETVPVKNVFLRVPYKRQADPCTFLSSIQKFVRTRINGVLDHVC